jgi:hypothetical protein
MTRWIRGTVDLAPSFRTQLGTLILLYFVSVLAVDVLLAWSLSRLWRRGTIPAEALQGITD